MGQSELPVGLLPVYPETAWEMCLLQAMAYLQREGRRFCSSFIEARCGICSGGTEDRFFREKKIITKSRENKCCDNGAIFEAFFLAWSLWIGSFHETKNDLSYDQMDELVRRCFFVDSIDIYVDEYPLGIVSGVLRLASWLPWFSFYDCSVQEVEDPRDLRFGDFCRIRDANDPRKGYTVIVLGDGWENGRPVIYTWTSHRKFKKNWAYENGTSSGYGSSFFYLRKVIDGWKRVFYGARLVDCPMMEYTSSSYIISQ